MTVHQMINERLRLHRNRLALARQNMGQAGHDDALTFAARVKADHAVIQELEDLLEEILSEQHATADAGQDQDLFPPGA